MQVFRGTLYVDDDRDGYMVEGLTLAVFGNAKTLDDWIESVIPGGWFAGLRIV